MVASNHSSITVMLIQWQDGGRYHKIPSFTGLWTGTVVNTVAELDLFIYFYFVML